MSGIVPLLFHSKVGASPSGTGGITYDEVYPPVVPQILAFGITNASSSGDGLLFRSDDGGATWSEDSPAEFSNGWLWDMAYSPALQRLVVIFIEGSSTSTGARSIYYSDDFGVTWTVTSPTHPFNTGAKPNMVIWSEVAEKFILLAVGAGGSAATPEIISYSSDGITWALASPTSTQAFDGTMFDTIRGPVVLNSDENEIYNSTDGVTWSTDAAAPLSTTDWLSSPSLRPAYASGIATGGGPGELDRAVYSTNSSNEVRVSEYSELSPWLYWENGTGTPGVGACSIAWSPSLYLFVTAADTSGIGGDRFSSVNGILWEVLEAGPLDAGQEIVWDPNYDQFIEIKSSGAVIETSPDGENWATSKSSSSNRLQGLLVLP